MRVLLIEDDPATAHTMELMLLGESFNVYTTDLGEEGIDLGKLYDYDVILLDLNLPVASGFVVLRWLSEQPVLRRIPVVVLSSSDRDEDVNLAYDLGANAYIVKPNGLKPLGEVAEQVARFWLTLNRRPSIE